MNFNLKIFKNQNIFFFYIILHIILAVFEFYTHTYVCMYTMIVFIQECGYLMPLSNKNFLDGILGLFAK